MAPANPGTTPLLPAKNSKKYWVIKFDKNKKSRSFWDTGLWVSLGRNLPGRDRGTVEEEVSFACHSREADGPPRSELEENSVFAIPSTPTHPRRMARRFPVARR